MKHLLWSHLSWKDVACYLKHSLIVLSWHLWMLPFAGYVTLFIFSCVLLVCNNLTFAVWTYSQLTDDCLSATTASCPLIESLILMSCPSIGWDGLCSLHWLQNLTFLDLSYTFLMNLQPVFESCSQLKASVTIYFHAPAYTAMQHSRFNSIKLWILSGRKVLYEVLFMWILAIKMVAKICFKLEILSWVVLLVMWQMM